MTTFTETREIPVRDNNVLEVKMTQKFIDRVRARCGLSADQPLENDHIRMYLFGAINTAVARAELGMQEDATKQSEDAQGVR